jgi:EAL domain-containing protein (putative c-di-GMP-specific phosphodiesterase class I)/GGDEF domain-containing protein
MPPADPKRERARFVATAFARADLLLELDQQGRIAFALGAASWAVGRAADELIGKTLDDVFAPGSGKIRDAIRAAAQQGRRLRPERVLLRRAGGFTRANIAGFPVPDAPGSFALSIAHEEEEPVPTPANEVQRSPVTGLREPASFASDATVAIKAARERGEEVKLTLVEAPGVTALKNSMTDAAGSALMQQIGAFLKAGSVGGDTASQVGDDKFSVLHGGNVDGTALAAGIAELAKAADPKGKGIVAKAYAMKLDDNDMSSPDVARAVAYAVSRFAEAQDGEFSLDSLSTSIEELVEKTVKDVAQFRGALAGQGFSLVYQPIVDLATEQPLYQEALTRLQDGSSPFRMVTFAEEIGVIAELDQSVVTQVLTMLDKDPSILDVTANVSARSLQSAAFSSELEKLLERFPDARQRMLIEVTESKRIANFEFTAKVLERIRKLKVRVCLDDFGAGATTFEYLRLLPFDVVKIDGGYIKDLGDNLRDRAFVRAMAELSKELGLVTVAEWVEARKQADVLKSLGVQRAQGFLFGRANEKPLRKPGFVDSDNVVAADARLDKLRRQAGATTTTKRR